MKLALLLSLSSAKRYFFLLFAREKGKLKPGKTKRKEEGGER